MESVDVDAFEALVADALATIPDGLRRAMDNVAILIDDESPPGSLYGLYEGVPLTDRSNYSGARPDRITLFLATICRSARTEAQLVDQIRVTLLHEVAHHFGIDDERLTELGWS
jgi:predicted Zn-dependent protease with MMP-like domain